MLGFVCFAVGARQSVVIAAVLGSQFAVVAGVVAYLFLEVMNGCPAATGVALIVAGVAALTWVTVG